MWLNKLAPYVSVVLFLIMIGVPTTYGGILLYRYSQPFRLFKASTKEKWGWAAKAIFFLFLPFLIMAIFYPLITPDQTADWVNSLYCVGFWLLVYPFLVICQMARFKFDEAMNIRMSKNIKVWKKTGLSSPFPTVFVPDRETKRFFQEGFPEEIVEGEQRSLQDLHKSKLIFQSASPENKWQLSIYGPTKKSPVFYAHFKNEMQITDEYVFPFGYLENEERLSVDWTLPNNTCGLYISDRCYCLFYYGEDPRSLGRYRARTKKNNYFTTATIEWFESL